MSEPVDGLQRGADAASRRLGVLTTDEHLIVTGWDAALASMTAIPSADAIGRELAALIPDLDSRGLLALVRGTLDTGTATVLAPALHKYFIPLPTARPSSRYQRMQQRVAVAPLFEQHRAAGLVITIEDVTERLEREHQLAAQLRNASPAERRAAVEQLAELDPVEGLGPLHAAIADDDWQVRRSAVTALAARRDPALVEALVSALRDGHRNFSVLSSALQLLTVTGIDVTAALIDLLEHSDPDLRIQAALALGMQRRLEAADPLLRALDDDNANVRFHAIEALGRLGAPAAIERLAAIAESKDFFLAFPALEALSHISDAAVAPRLVPLLQDELVGDQAAEALGQIGDEEVVVPLVSALDRPHLSPASVVAALTALQHRHAELFSGGADRIEELARRSISAAGAARIVDGAGRASGASLRQFVTVLGWLRGDAVEQTLAHMLGTPDAQLELLEAISRFGPSMVDRLIEQLQRGDRDTRRAVVVALGRLGDARAVEPLIRLVDDDERELLVPATAALARLGDLRAFESLLALLGDADLPVRQGAVAALNAIGHPQMADRMGVLLEDVDALVRESAVKIAGYFGYASCADALLARCRDEDEAVRAAALEHVAYLDDPRSLPLLVEAMAGETPRARAAAAQALGHADGRAAIDALRRGAVDPDAWVRYFSVTSLGTQGNAAALPLLKQIAANDTAPHVRIAAVLAIGDIGVSGDADVLPLLAAFSDGADDELAIAAARALGSVEDVAALEPLRRALSASQPDRRVAAAEAIGRRGGPTVVEVLGWSAAADDDPRVMRAALASLGRIGAGTSPWAAGAIAAIAAVATEPPRRAEAIATLARVPESAIPSVGNALSSREPSVRRAVLEALGRLAHPSASAYILSAVEDDDASVRQLAVTILSRLGSRGVTRPLAHVAESDPSEGVRRAAALALRRLGADHGSVAHSDGQ